MADLSNAAAEFTALAQRLAILADVDINREIGQAISDAAEPMQHDIRAGMKDYFPNPYAAVLDADLSLSISKSTGADPGVRITASTRSRRKRRLRRFDEQGVLGHPVFGMRMRSNPRLWAAWDYQTSHVRAGFFTEPAEHSAPRVRESILGAMRRINDKAAGR